MKKRHYVLIFLLVRYVLRHALPALPVGAKPESAPCRR